MERQRIGKKRVMGHDIRPLPKPQPTSLLQETTKKKAAKSLEINVSFPSLKIILTRIVKLKKTFQKIPRKFLIVVGLIVVIALSVFFKQQSQPMTPKVVHTPRDVSEAATTLQRGTPKYATILPSNKTIEQLGGWTRVSPPDRNPVFAYLDKIGDIPINVSEQPLPEGFEIEADGQLEQLAAGFKANEKMTAGSTQIYIGTSAKGPQSVIFSKASLLVLIKSSVKVSNDQWSAYVNSLQ